MFLFRSTDEDCGLQRKHCACKYAWGNMHPWIFCYDGVLGRGRGN